MTARVERAFPWAIGLWACGVQVHELFATIGGWVAVLLAATWLVSNRSWKDERAVLGPALAFLALGLIAPALSGHTPTGSGAARLTDVLFFPALAIAARRSDARALERVALAAGGVLLVSCLAAGLQYFGVWPRAEAFESSWWAYLSTQRVYEAVPGRDDRFMGGGLLLHRLRFANVSAVVVVLAAARAFRLPSRRLVFTALTVIGLTSVAIFPHARAATASLVLAVIVVAATGAERRVVGLAASGGVVLLAALVIALVPSVRTRFAAALESSGTADRAALSEAGVSAFRTAPLTGIGAGRFRPGDWLPADAPPELKLHQGKAHDQFLTIATEGGVFTLAAFLALLVLAFVSAFRALPNGSAGLGVLVLLIASSILHDPLFHAEASMAAFGALGVALGLCQRRPS